MHRVVGLGVQKLGWRGTAGMHQIALSHTSVPCTEGTGEFLNIAATTASVATTCDHPRRLCLSQVAVC